MDNNFPPACYPRKATTCPKRQCRWYSKYSICAHTNANSKGVPLYPGINANKKAR